MTIAIEPHVLVGVILFILWVTVILLGGWFEGRHRKGYAEDSAEVDGIIFPDEPRHWS